MQGILISGLDSIGHGARTIALLLFLAANAAYLGGVLARKSQFVNRWTSSWLAANVAALAIGAGVPMVTGLMQLALGGDTSSPSVTSVTTK